MFIDSGSVTCKWSKEPPAMTSIEEFKIELAIEEGGINWSGLIKN